VADIVITTHARAVEAYRNRNLRQALYDAGDVIMADVLVNLHGDEHRDRRRLENRLYTRERLAAYERDLFPPIVEATLRPHAERGRAELVGLGHQLMMNLAATAAGLDRPEGTPEETERLYAFLRVFVEGATLAHYTGDRAAKAAEVAAALDAFDDEFLAASIQRRKALLAEGAELPHDVLAVLLANADELPLPHEVIRREVAFYLLAGAHTSATAFTRITHNVLAWRDAHPADAERVTDLAFLERCASETIRLEPSSPIALRRVVADTTLGDGTALRVGDTVTIDLLAANRDPAVWGDRADGFDPFREAPEGVAPWGLSFGHGMHHCIGAELAAGATRRSAADDDRLWGLVPISVQWLFRNGCRPDPDEAPTRDQATARPYFARYPVLLGDPADR
jgi:cytochrome P450